MKRLVPALIAGVMVAQTLTTPTAWMPTVTTVVHFRAATALKYVIRESVLIVRCGTDIVPEKPVIIRQMAPTHTWTRTFADCTAGYITVPAISDDVTVQVSQDDSATKPPVFRRF